MSKLECNANRPLTRRSYEFALLPRGSASPLTVLYASDLHLNRHSGHIVEQVLEAIREAKPDLVLLGGDLVDTRGGLPLLKEVVQAGNVAAIPGNHESWVGAAAVRRHVIAAGGHWLPDAPLEQEGLRIGADAADLVCAHDPAGFPAAVRRGARLVLAGHLHGSQMVWGAARNGRLYPGAWFFRWNGDRFTGDHGSTLLVSRGVNDTLPIRWNCPRDVLVCRIVADPVL